MLAYVIMEIEIGNGLENTLLFVVGRIRRFGSDYLAERLALMAATWRCSPDRANGNIKVDTARHGASRQNGRPREKTGLLLW